MRRVCLRRVIMVATNNNRTARLLAVAALVAAVVGSIVVLVMPVVMSGGMVAPTTLGETVTMVPTFTTEVVWFGLVQSQGIRILIYMAIPVMICVAAVLAMRLKDGASRGVLLYTLALILFALDFMAMMSIGIFYFPAAVLLLAAAFSNSQKSSISR